MKSFFNILGLVLFATSFAEETHGRILNGGFAGENMRNLDGKTAVWPSLVGQSGEAAAEAIRAERPDLGIVATIPENAMVTRDMRFDRVRIFVNGEGNVIKPPRVG